MTRRIVTTLLMTTMIAAGSGCSSLKLKNPFAAKPVPEPEQLPAKQWAALRAENQRRLAGEGIPPRGGSSATQPAPPAAPPVGAVDQFTGFFHFVFIDFPRRTYDFYTGKTPGRYSRMMEDDTSADLRRSGILRLVADYPFARAEPYTDRYWQIAQGDPDTLVRVAALRALDRARDRRAVPLAVRYLDDADPLLRLEAAKALANLPDERATAALLRHMAPAIESRGEAGGRPEFQNESRDVRVACADALRNVPTKDVARALADALRDKQFEVSYQARKSLVLLTGHDFRYDVQKWRDYLSATENPFGS